MASASRGRRPEPITRDLDEYLVHGRPEILALLRALAQAGTLVTAYTGGDGDFFVTTILAVDPESDAFLLEDGPGSRVPGEGEPLTLVTFLDSVKVQFESRSLGTVGHEGQRALRARIPARLLRLQRREAYRVATPPLRAPVCRLPAAPGRASADLRVADVSCGGVALALAAGDKPLEPGERLAGCVLELPGVPAIVVTLEARHTQSRPLAARDGRGLRTCGCRFADLPGPAATQIQRYVNSVERERLRLRA